MALPHEPVGDDRFDPLQVGNRDIPRHQVHQVIYCFKFPKPDVAMWEKTNLLSTHYWVPGTIAQAADFYRKTLVAQGWSGPQPGVGHCGGGCRVLPERACQARLARDK